VVGWQLEKWVLGGNIFIREHKVLYGNDLGGRIFLTKFRGEIFARRRVAGIPQK
jgi:hypothetical protein